MSIRISRAHWDGDLKGGCGQMIVGDDAWRGDYAAATRFGEAGGGTNPEELIGAAHAGCFSMALAGELARQGHTPTRIETEARVHLDKGREGFDLSRIELHVRAEVPGIDEDTFRDSAERAKATCPVSRALSGVQIEVHPRLAAPA